MFEPNPKLIEYIKLCREQGYEDYQIRIPLLDNGWELHDVQAAFYAIRQEEDKKLKKKEITKDNKTIYVYKNSMTIHLDSDVLRIIEKRAKKNMLTPVEQVEDIVRRSCVSAKKKDSEPKDNVDDLFLKLFSRKNTGRPRKA